MSVPPDDHAHLAPGVPIPPQDRLWRHPSELGLASDTGPRVILRRRPSFGRVLAAAAVGLIGGTVLGIGALAVTGSLDGGSGSTSVERLAAPAPRTTAAGELAVADTALPAVASVSVDGPAGTRTATAVVVRDDGLLLTTSDSLDAADAITVTLEDGSTYPATLVGRDRRSDLGILDIDASSLPVVALPDARLDQALDFGDQVVLVATDPAADPTAPAPTVLRGVVSDPSKGLTTAATAGVGDMFGMVEVRLDPDVASTPGGGILLDGNGSLIGVVTDRNDEDGVRYATPFDHARRVYTEVAEAGNYDQAELAVNLEPLAPQIAEDLDVPGGVVVAGGNPDSGNPDAGLEPGDVITAINGTVIADLNDSQTEVRRYAPGTQVDVTVIRDGQPTTLVATLGSDARVP